MQGSVLVQDLRARRVALSVLVALAFTPFMPLSSLAGSPFDMLIDGLRGSSETIGITSSNGRIEVQSLDVATRYTGQLIQVLVSEGDVVEAGTVLARLDDRTADAQLHGARATVLQAKAAKAIADASVMQAQSALALAQTTHDRTAALHADGHASIAALENATNSLNSAGAALAMAKAQVQEAEAQVAASQADLERLTIVRDDLTIRAPIRGRVVYRLHEPGEVVAAGTPVLTIFDLSNVYMNIYLPAAAAGTLALGDEARLILDPAPQFVFPARVSFVSSQSQFTPRSVETKAEREELVFRVKLAIPHELLQRYEALVKSGVRGEGFVRLNPNAPWPDDLAVRLPD